MVERPQLFRSTRRDIADAREKHSTSTVRVGRLTLCSLVAYKQANPGIEAAEAGKYARSAEEDCRRQALSMTEYHELVSKSVHLLQSVVPTSATPLEDHHQDEHIFPNIPNTGATIGRYTHASHHSDGLFSEVFRAVDPDTRTDRPNANSVVALKITTPSLMTPPHDAVREARILDAAKGSTIIPLLETFQQPGGRFVLVFPFVPYDLGTLLQQGHFQKQRANPSVVVLAQRTILRDLFTGLAHLHSLGILHRDIKPGNILLASPQGPAYLADFGIAWSSSDRASEPENQKILDIGTTSYRAPELLFGCTTYSVGVDLWAAGCVAAQLVRDDGRRPLFDAGDLGSELALIKSIFTTLGTPDDEGRMWPETRVPGRLPDWGKFRFQQFLPMSWSREILPGVEEPAVELVRKLVMYESGSRLSASEALRHPYIQYT